MKKYFSLSVLLTLCATFPLHSHPSFELIEDSSGLEIKNPSLSERKAAKLRLANGLEAYIVSDPGVKQSAAALAVEVGSWSDPIEYPGTAHFLEHMLFMGTKAYPGEREYANYITDNGGSNNAYTAPDRTVYMFSINNESFEGALDRFSHFFIDPLFSTSSIEKELHAVDQEHSKNIEHDGWRQYMVFKETGNPNHPNIKFSTGNANTLRNIPQKVLQDWYYQHYNARKMHLVILSSLPLEELISLTVEDFSKVANHNSPKKLWTSSITSDKQRGHFIYIKPIKDLKNLSLTWELPSSFAMQKEVQIGKLLTYIFQNGSKNSLLYLLKKEHLAQDVLVEEETLSKTNKLFTINIELSEKGLSQLNQVITLCFEALARLKQTGIPRYIYDEVENIENIKYEYQSRSEAFDFVAGHAAQMIYENIDTYPQKTLFSTKYDSELAHNYLEQLRAENCIFFVIADPSKTQVTMTTTEQWLGVEYAIKPISVKQLSSWSAASINTHITLPPPNSFIPKNLHLIHTQINSAPITPVLLEDSSVAKVFFAEDQKYLVPETMSVFRIKSPLLDDSAKAKALSDLYIKSLTDQLFPISSAAELAGLKVSFSQEKAAFSTVIVGYSDQSDRLLEEIFKGIKTVQISRAQFELYKQELLATYENGEKELPLYQSLELMRSILFKRAPTSRDKLQALQVLSYEEFSTFCQHLFKKAYLEGLLYGNLDLPSAEKLWKKVKKELHFEIYPAEERLKRQILLLSEARGPYMVQHLTPMQGNAALLLIEEGPFSFEKKASQYILGKILKDAFFDTLRTKQQTGYIVQAWDREEEKELLQYFAVQSSNYLPQELLVRFELFLETFLKQYSSQVPLERFENIRKRAISTLQMAPENLFLMGSRLFLLAFDYDADFDFFNKWVRALETLSYEKTQEDALEFFSRKNTKRLAVLIEGSTSKEKDFRYEITSKEDLHQQGDFVVWK